MDRRHEEGDSETNETSPVEHLSVMEYFPRIRTIAVGTLLVFLVYAVGPGTLAAQERVDFSNESTVLVDGTSNQSDWTVTADSLYGWLSYAPTADATPTISGAELHVLSREIKSNKSPIMDRLMYRTLKSTEFEEIVFELTSVEAVTLVEAKPDSFAVSLTGNLTIAGVTKQIQTTIGGEKSADAGYRFTGRYDLAMTDYGMKPPTALFGALHTGDGVTVRFELFVRPE